ncbi:MAG: hypothetical protein AABM67_18570 [Acidobacteriota bacterium]
MTPLAKRIIIGVVAVVLLVVIAIGILIGASVIGWKSALRSGNEAATIQNLGTIAAVEIQYYNAHSRNFGTFEQLVQDGFDARFSGNPPVVDGYVFTLKLVPKTASQASSYKLNADPESSSSGKNHFYLESADGVIRVNADHPAGPDDPALAP